HWRRFRSGPRLALAAAVRAAKSRRHSLRHRRPLREFCRRLPTYFRTARGTRERARIGGYATQRDARLRLSRLLRRRPRSTRLRLLRAGLHDPRLRPRLMAPLAVTP